MKDLELKVDLPYPKIVGAQEDSNTVAILKNLLSSRSGELAGVLQYIYQSVMSDKINAEIAEIFEEIGIVEMMHMSILMHAITDFGGVPKYEDARGNYFTSSSINFSPRLKDMLDNNIAGEKQAIEEYNQAIHRVKNESLKALLTRLILDEEKHLEAFKYLRDSVQFLSL